MFVRKVIFKILMPVVCLIWIYLNKYKWWSVRENHASVVITSF
jgi:hypothetical protein